MEKNTSKLTGIALATAVAGLFTMVAAAPAFASEDGTVKCEHSSACKGHGACATEANSCKGENACRGQGMTLQKDQAACEKAQKEASKVEEDQQAKKG